MIPLSLENNPHLLGGATPYHQLKGKAMKRNVRMIFRVTATTSLVIAVMILSGCQGEQKMEPVKVGKMETYRDPGIGFQIQYPQGWIVNAQVGQARFFNAQDVDQKFLDPTGPYPTGVMIAVDMARSDSTAMTINQMKDDISQQFSGAVQTQSISVAGKDATKISYKAKVSADQIIQGYHVLVPSDSAVYDLHFSGFGNMFEAYSAVFDAALASFKPPKPVVKGRDETLPSETYEVLDTKFFSLEYPDNWEISNPPKGSFEFSLQLRGYRADETMRFDVFDAKGLTVEKVFDQNKSNYRSKSTGKTTIGGESALYVNYSPASQVDSRAYFLVHNGKVVRITLNWFRPQQNIYLPAYEKILGGLKLK